ncbi:MAG: maleylpyruvate isomerase family mycothiol-dependent enzyme, partial [Acidimicrobiales bacterium]
MEASPNPWIAALRQSHDTLQALVEPLDSEQVTWPSYDAEWSIAQLLSHIGSGADIFGLFLDAGLSGQDPPGPQDFAPIWEKWNTKDQQAQATDALVADEVVVKRFESLSPDEIARFHLSVFGMELDATGLARMRLSELALHTWDVAVALDPTARVAPDAVGLLVDTLGLLAERIGKPDGSKWRVGVTTADPERRFTLELDEKVTLAAFEPGDSLASLALPAEAFVRLVYGRLDPAHTPPVEAHGVDLD